MLNAYRDHVAERAALGLPPLPLNPEQTAQLVDLLKAPPAGEEQTLLDLLENRVPAGVDQAAYVKGFEALVGSWPQVRECHMLAGESDFMLKIVAEDWDSYQKFLTTKLTAAPNVSHVKSSLGIRTSKYQPGVPVHVE